MSKKKDENKLSSENNQELQVMADGLAELLNDPRELIDFQRIINGKKYVVTAFTLEEANKLLDAIQNNF